MNVCLFVSPRIQLCRSGDVPSSSGHFLRQMSCYFPRFSLGFNQLHKIDQPRSHVMGTESITSDKNFLLVHEYSFVYECSKGASTRCDFVDLSLFAMIWLLCQTFFEFLSGHGVLFLIFDNLVLQFCQDQPSCALHTNVCCLVFSACVYMRVQQRKGTFPRTFGLLALVFFRVRRAWAIAVNFFLFSKSRSIHSSFQSKVWKSKYCGVTSLWARMLPSDEFWESSRFIDALISLISNLHWTVPGCFKFIGILFCGVLIFCFAKKHLRCNSENTDKGKTNQLTDSQGPTWEVHSCLTRIWVSQQHFCACRWHFTCLHSDQYCCCVNHNFMNAVKAHWSIQPTRLALDTPQQDPIHLDGDVEVLLHMSWDFYCKDYEPL